MNENGLVNLLVDVDFIDGQLRDIGRGHLSNAFKELKAVSNKYTAVYLAFDAFLDYFASPAEQDT